MSKKDILVYDVEINRLLKGKEWGQIDRSLFASAVVYSYQKDRYFFFLHLGSIDTMAKMMDGSIAVSFNGINFDSKVILGSRRSLRGCGKTGIILRGDGIEWAEYDIFIQCLKFVNNKKTDIEAMKSMSPGGLKLNDIAVNTLNERKSGSGSLAPTLYRSGRFDELLEYNFNDVRMTRRIFEHSLKYSRLVGRGVKVNVRKDGFHAKHFAEILEMVLP